MAGSRRDLAFLVFSVLAFALLVWLGMWQVERMQWKEDLIARLNDQLAAQPLPVAEVEAHQAAGEDVEFMRATAKGRFRHDDELFVFSTVDGEMGWKVITPLELGGALDGVGAVLVDRGFIPYDLKDPATRPDSQPAGSLSVTGAVRPHASVRAPFQPDNEPEANVWHWWALPAMAEAAGLDRPATFVLQAEPQPGGPDWPRAFTPDPADIPNRHLGYAATWFGLAVMLVVVNGFYLSRRRREATPRPSPPKGSGEETGPR